MPPRRHGRSLHPDATYRAWKNMIQRCTNPRTRDFDRYGARGIRVCKRWRQFEHFLADMGEKPTGLTLERKNNDGHYEPGNCVWATYTDQNRNRGRKRAPKLNVVAVCLIRHLHRRGIRRARLAETFAVSPTMIRSVVNYISWRS